MLYLFVEEGTSALPIVNLLKKMIEGGGTVPFPQYKVLLGADKVS